MLEKNKKSLIFALVENFQVIMDTFEGDLDIVSDCFWGLCALLDNSEDNIISVVISNGLPISFIKYLNSSKDSIAIAALRSLGNVGFSKNNPALEQIADHGMLDKLQDAMFDNLKVAKKEIYWAIANYVADSHKIAAMLARTDIVDQALQDI